MSLVAGALLTATVVPAVAQDSEANDRIEWFGGGPTDRWVFGAEAYLWGASIGGTSANGDDVDIGFGSLLKDLDLGFMTTLGAAKGRWTVFADLIYLNVSDDVKGPDDIIELDVRLKGVVSTFGAAYSLAETDRSRFNLFGGGRYLWLDAKLKLEIEDENRGSLSDSGAIWDAVIGLRGKTDLNDKWYLTYFADIGTGQSKLTWQALAAISYRFRKLDAVVGYRYLDWNFDNDSGAFNDLNFHGPFAGVKVRF
jgi:hypothetical protein